jgi:hypothetical protein
LEKRGRGTDFAVQDFKISLFRILNPGELSKINISTPYETPSH